MNYPDYRVPVYTLRHIADNLETEPYGIAGIKHIGALGGFGSHHVEIIVALAVHHAENLLVIAPLMGLLHLGKS